MTQSGKSRGGVFIYTRFQWNVTVTKLIIFLFGLENKMRDYIKWKWILFFNFSIRV